MKKQVLKDRTLNVAFLRLRGAALMKEVVGIVVPLLKNNVIGGAIDHAAVLEGFSADSGNSPFARK